MLSLLLRNRIVLLLMLALSPIVIAEETTDPVRTPIDAIVTLNALEKMKQPLSFKQQNIVARLMTSQKKQINEGVLTEFESRCIASNMVIMLGDGNAEKFAITTEKAYEHGMVALSHDEIDFMRAIQDKYGVYLSLVASECSQPDTKEKNE